MFIKRKCGLELGNQYLESHVQHRWQCANDISERRFGLIMNPSEILVKLAGPDLEKCRCSTFCVEFHGLPGTVCPIHEHSLRIPGLSRKSFSGKWRSTFLGFAAFG